MAEAGGGRGEADGTGAAMADASTGTTASTAVDREPGRPEYLANYSEAFAAAADVVVVVGEAALPAHSHVLRMHSSVLDNALESVLTGSATKPLPEDGLPRLELCWPATEEEARAFLRVIYSKEIDTAKRMICEDNTHLIASLAHQLNAGDLLV